jgi:predicted nucleic acid-binding protein
MRNEPSLLGEQQLPNELLIDSMILMDYDGGHSGCIDWWEESVFNGCKIYVSTISLMERYKGIAHWPGERRIIRQEFEERIEKMKHDKKIYGVLPVNKRIVTKAYELLREYCLHYTPPQERSRMEALICDMIIAATALVKRLPICTFNQKDFGWINYLHVLKPDYEV